MDNHQCAMTNRILDLILEIICLLTGEDYTVIKKKLTASYLHDSFVQEINKKQKILKVLHQMIGLLTGEVPIRCQDVSVYFSMEEWEYLEGHKDLYKDIVMMEDQSPLTSPDGSSNRNPPKRCSLPLDSMDSIEEGHTIPCHDQVGILWDCNVVVKQEFKKEEEDQYDKEEFSEGYMDMMESPNCRNPPEKCPYPLFSQYLKQEDHAISYHDQCEEAIDIKAEIKEPNAAASVSDDHQSTGGSRMMVGGEDQEFAQDIGTDGHNVTSQERHEISSLEHNTEDNAIGEHSPGGTSIHCRPYYVDRSMDPSKPEDSLHDCQTVTNAIYVADKAMDPVTPQRPSSGNFEPPSNTDDEILLCSEVNEGCFNQIADLFGHQQCHTSQRLMVERSFPCEICGNYFSGKEALLKHQRNKGTCPFLCSESGLRKVENLVLQEGPKSKRSFECLECGKSFTREGNLLTHQRIHTGERPFSCSECGKSFADKGNYNKHMRSHTGERPFSCSDCGKSFIYKSGLIFHQKSHTGNNQFSCSECGKGCIDKTRLLIHQRSHMEKRPFSCSECGKGFTIKGNLNNHLRLHTGVRPFSCLDCGKSFSLKAGLTLHQRTHTGERPFSCSVCGKGFAQKPSLLIHQRTHTGERPISCSECGKSFIDRGNFTKHLQTHTDAHLFVCLDCGKCFTQKGELIIHQKSHIENHPFSCLECGKGFSHKSRLLLHQRIHTGERPFSCLECEKCFADRRNFIKHQRTHTGEHPFSCLDCGKCFTQKGSLTLHQRSHTGERPFSCSECGKSYAAKRNLFIHQKVHTGELPFCCSECGKGFTRHENLKAHQKIHTGERPFSCSHCGKCFIRKARLLIHQRNHMGSALSHV